MRLFLCWLVLLALPLQGLAATSRLHCSVHTGAAQMHVHAGHEDRQGAEATAHAHHAGVEDADAGDPQVAGSCSACAACCATLGLSAPMPHCAATPPPAVMVARALAQPSSFVPDGLERPPRAQPSADT